MAAVLTSLRHPVVLAPLAGGATTPALVAAVGEAGGIGFIGAGYRSADDTAAQIAAVRDLTGAPFGVNVFVPRRDPIDPAALAAYVQTLENDAARLGVAVGEPRDEDDDWDAKIALQSLGQQGRYIKLVALSAADNRPWTSAAELQIIGLVERYSDVLQRRIEVVVRRVQVTQEALQGGRGLDVVANGQEKPMRDVDENRHLVEIVRDR